MSKEFEKKKSKKILQFKKNSLPLPPEKHRIMFDTLSDMITKKIKNINT